MRANLGYCGRPIPTVCGDAPEHGWGDLHRHEYAPPVGARWLSNVDTPERALWRARYPARFAPLERRGAFPCIGLLTRREIMGERAGFAIRYEAGG